MPTSTFRSFTSCRALRRRLRRRRVVFQNVGLISQNLRLDAARALGWRLSRHAAPASTAQPRTTTRQPETHCEPFFRSMSTPKNVRMLSGPSPRELSIVISTKMRPRSRQSGIRSRLKLRRPAIFRRFQSVREQLVLAPSDLEVAVRRTSPHRPPARVRRDASGRPVLRRVVERDEAEVERRVQFGRRVGAALKRVELDAWTCPDFEARRVLEDVPAPGRVDVLAEWASSHTGGFARSAGTRTCTSAVRTPCIVSPSIHHWTRSSERPRTR